MGRPGCGGGGGRGWGGGAGAARRRAGGVRPLTLPADLPPSHSVPHVSPFFPSKAQELAKNFDLTSAWVGARARATGRRWAAVLGRRQALDDALARTCADLEAEHTPLVAANLAPWVAARGLVEYDEKYLW